MPFLPPNQQRQNTEGTEVVQQSINISCPQGPWQEHTHVYTHLFNGPFSGTTRVSRYQKGKTNLDFTGARDSEWQWHQLGHMQVCPWQETHRILFATLGVLCSCDKACASLVFVVFSQYWFRRQLNGHLFQEA